MNFAQASNRVAKWPIISQVGGMFTLGIIAVGILLAAPVAILWGLLTEPKPNVRTLSK